jgi:hypothetical protein
MLEAYVSVSSVKQSRCRVVAHRAPAEGTLRWLVCSSEARRSRGGRHRHTPCRHEWHEAGVEVEEGGVEVEVGVGVGVEEVEEV